MYIIGHGATPKAAVEDLRDQMAEAIDDREDEYGRSLRNVYVPMGSPVLTCDVAADLPAYEAYWSDEPEGEEPRAPWVAVQVLAIRLT